MFFTNVFLESLKHHVAGGALEAQVVADCEILTQDWITEIESILAEKFDEKCEFNHSIMKYHDK